MLVIDNDAERRMIQTLESLRIESEATRCVHFKKHAVSADQPIRHVLLKAIEQHAPSLQARLFCLDDGDVLMLSSDINGKQMRQIMLDVANNYDLPADDALASIYDTDIHVNKLLLMLEHKLKRRRELEDSMQRDAEKLEAERKKQAILYTNYLVDMVSDIGQRRTERENVEIMIIEDDTFSCRLVERALQPLFPITALGTADTALDSYTRIAPDILFLDINLPNVTGHELLERFIAIDPDAYIVMLSGNADHINITTAINRGAKGFIAKPFTAEKLKQYIDRCPTIRRKRERHASAH